MALNFGTVHRAVRALNCLVYGPGTHKDHSCTALLTFPSTNTIGAISQPLYVSSSVYIFAILPIWLRLDSRWLRRLFWNLLHKTDYTETSLTSDGEDVYVDKDEDVGLQAALAASQLEMENVLRQEELEFQRAVEPSKDADQDVTFKLDTERAIEMSLEQERTWNEMREA
ncbi:hypothetical protein EDD85DRAFT_1029220 [Armillaria nabsnona]|nr:hypothetical protein EDD85DRAFT_1029220 [Armillaria nabsnona]